MENNTLLVSDSIGNLKQTIYKNGQDLTLRLSLIGLNDINIKIRKDITGLNGTVNFDDYWIRTSNDLISYKILKIQKKKLNLSAHDESYIYRKISEEDFLKMTKHYNSNKYHEIYIKAFL